MYVFLGWHNINPVLGGLNNSLTVQEAEKSKIKVRRVLVSGEAALPGFQTSLCGLTW